jgi:uncharacterized membrane protein
MARLIYAIILGLVGAAIIHIAVLMLIPIHSDQTAWSGLEQAGPLYQPVRLDEPGLAVRSIDPLFDAIGCRFDLREGVVRVSSPPRVSYWSMAVHDRRGLNLFNFNDKTSAAGIVDVVVATPSQMIELRNDLPAAFERSIFVEANVDEGIAVVRSFVPDESWEPQVADYLRGIRCQLHVL